MNRGSINSYTINGRSPRGGAVRVAADLIGYAVVSATAKIHRRYIGPITAQATVATRVGRRWVQLGAIAANEAQITLLAAVTRIRALTNFVGQAATTLTAKAGRRAIFGVGSQAQVNLVGRAQRRSPQTQTAQATVTGQVFRIWRRSVFVLPTVADISVSVRSVRIQFARLFAQFLGIAQMPTVPGRRNVLTDLPTTAEARIRLSAGVQNNFPYDEDAPDERTFIVAGEDNIFYVVD